MTTKPNVLFILTDQQRWDTIACAGNNHMVTPNLDWLAEHGVRFDHAFTPAPLCTPARASLVTGCYVHHHGVKNNSTWIPDDSDTWPRVFTEAGYDTRAIGKMHSAPWRNDTGFAQRVIAEDKYCFEMPDDYALWLEERGYKRPCPWRDHLEEYLAKRGCVVWDWPEELHIDSFVGAKAVEALEEVAARGKPFCHWVSFNSPHPMHDPPQRFLDMYRDRDVPAPVRRPYEPFDKPASRMGIAWFLDKMFGLSGDMRGMTDDAIKERRRYYYATITLVDYWIGELIKTLKAQGLYENTIIVFASDHGDSQGDHNLIEKSFFYEAMVRIPMIVHYPAAFRPQVSAEFVELHDLAPTLLSCAGLRVPSHMDGRDLSPLLRETDSWESRDAVFSENYWPGVPMSMIRTRDWKLVYEDEPTCCELYDLRNDPNEFRNVYHDPGYSSVRDDLVTRVKAWRSTRAPLFRPEDLLQSDYEYHLYPERHLIP